MEPFKIEVKKSKNPRLLEKYNLRAMYPSMNLHPTCREIGVWIASQESDILEFKLINENEIDYYEKNYYLESTDNVDERIPRLYPR